MIRASKKILLSLIVLTSVFMMSLYFGGSHATVLKAEGAQKYYRSERMGIPAVSINGSLATSYMTNGYYDITKVPGHYSEWHEFAINIPNLNNEITNFDIATIDEAYFKFNIKYTGTDSNVIGYRFQYFDVLINATSLGGNMYEVKVPYDARNMTSGQSQKVTMTPLDAANGNGGYIPTNGATRVNGVTVSVDYHFDVDDPISPVVDGAGALVESVNLLKPNISFPIDVKGIQLDYDYETGIYTLDGTANDTKVATSIFTDYFDPGEYVLQYFYISGNMDNLLSIVSTPGANIYVGRNQANKHFDHFMKATLTSPFRLMFYSDNETRSYDNFKFKLQLEKGTVATEWMHPDAVSYSTASIQHDQALDSPSTIRSNIYAFDDVDGNISSRLKIIDTARDFAAWKANQLGLSVNDVLSGYDDETLNIPITSTVTLTKAYIDAQFDIYKADTYWHNFDNDTLETRNLTAAYKMIVYVGDTAGNYTFLEIFVFINDATAPVFDESNPLTVTVSYKITFDFDNWLLTLIITDNHDDDVARVVHVDGYTSNKSTPGSYTVTVRATDETGNIKDQAFTFKVIDDIKPTFNGPESIFKPQSSQMTVNNILTRYTAFDEISGNVTSRIIILEDNYTGRGHIANTYTVTLKVTDLAGNFETFIIYITVSDDIPPVIYVADGYFIQVSAAYILTIEGIRDILVATGRLNIVSATTWTVLVNEYQGNENKPGIYTISVRFSQTSGVTEVHSVAVNVKNASTDPGGTFQPESNFNIILYAGIGIGAVFIFIALRKKR